MEAQTFLLETLLIIFILCALCLLVRICLGIYFTVKEYNQEKINKDEIHDGMINLLNFFTSILADTYEDEPEEYVDDVIEKNNVVKNVEKTKYEDLTYVDLKKIAQERKIPGYYRMNKEKLIKILSE